MEEEEGEEKEKRDEEEEEEENGDEDAMCVLAAVGRRGWGGMRRGWGGDGRKPRMKEDEGKKKRRGKDGYIYVHDYERSMMMMVFVPSSRYETIVKPIL